MGCLYEGDSLKNHYPRGALIRVGRSFEGGAQLNIYYQGGGGGGGSFEGALIREGTLFRGSTAYRKEKYSVSKYYLPLSLNHRTLLILRSFCVKLFETSEIHYRKKNIYQQIDISILLGLKEGCLL